MVMWCWTGESGTEPGAHWEGLRAAIMQQDLISCSLDLSLFSFLLPLLPNSLYFYLHSSLHPFYISDLLPHPSAHQCDLNQYDWPNKVTQLLTGKRFFLASSGHVRWTSAALWWWKHTTSRACFTAIHHFFYLKVKLVMLVLRVVAHVSLHVF